MMNEQIKTDEDAILKEADGLLKDPGKRRLLGNVLTLGGLSLATGVTLEHYGSVKKMLEAVSRFLRWPCFSCHGRRPPP